MERDALLGVQVCLCSLLIITCLVSIRGVTTAFQTPLGFNSDGVFAASFDLNQGGYDRVRGEALRAQVLETLSTAPGIDGVTFTSSIPLTTDQSSDSVVADTAVESTRPDSVDANAFVIPPGYFEVMETRLVAGRDFTPSDKGVAIINQTLARRLFGTSNAVVRRGIRRAPGQPLIEIIGLAEDGKYGMPGEAPRPAIYWSASRAYRPDTNLLIRSRLPAEQVARMTRRAIADLDPGLPVTFQGSLGDVTSLAFLPATAAAVILSAFGAIALVLALTGIYGLASYTVSARTREIGIRSALGADSRQVLSTMLGRTAVVLVAGVATGVALAMLASPLLSMAVYQATSRDPVIVGASAVVMVMVGLAAAWAPARRALRVQPAVTLRDS